MKNYSTSEISKFFLNIQENRNRDHVLYFSKTLDLYASIWNSVDKDDLFPFSYGGIPMFEKEIKIIGCLTKNIF